MPLLRRPPMERQQLMHNPHTRQPLHPITIPKTRLIHLSQLAPTRRHPPFPLHAIPPLEHYPYGGVFTGEIFLVDVVAGEFGGAAECLVGGAPGVEDAAWRRG